MRHHNKIRTLGRTKSQRTALIRGLAISLIEHEQITTTAAKAKELRPFAERLVTYAKKGDLSSRRNAATALGEPQGEVVKKLFDTLASRYKERAGGYTRIIKMGRTGAGRDMALIEFV